MRSHVAVLAGLFMFVLSGCSDSTESQDGSSGPRDQGVEFSAVDGAPPGDAHKLPDLVAVADRPLLDLQPDKGSKPDTTSPPDQLLPDLPLPDQGSATAGWVQIKPGKFQMGSPVGENCRTSKEQQHQVTLTRGFEISPTEVTQGQFSALMSYNPSHFKTCGTDCPVDNMKWDQAAAYCNALSKKSGLTACYACTGSTTSTTCAPATAYAGKAIYSCKGYRLPTEAEWEYAYRAGTTTALYNGPLGYSACSNGQDANANQIGWYWSNSSAGTKLHKVKQKKPNTWGLYDMAGNVWEYCHDRYQDLLGTAAVTDPVGSSSLNGHVLKGGSYALNAGYLRAAARQGVWSSPWQSYWGMGFRCVRTR